MIENNLQQYLASDENFDFTHPQIKQLAERVQATDAKQQAIEIYYLVRDGFPYNPYTFVEGPSTFSANFCTANSQGYCIPKAALMVALCRYHGIPAKIGFADVTNHLSSPKLTALLQTEVFSMHGYVSVYLNGKWVKATPTFNKELCEKLGTKTLEFNGESDSLFQEFTEQGQKHMEYLKDWGTFGKMPTELILENFNKHYSHIMKALDSAADFKDAVFN